MKTQKIQFIEKSFFGRLSDCEAHIYFLDIAVDNYYNKHMIHYKQVAGELRVLVADNSRKNNGIIIDLMDDLGLEYRFDYDNKKVTIKEFMSDFGGVLNRKKFTKAELVRAIAQNEGSSHESKSLPDHIALGHSFKINGIPIHIEQLMIYSKYIVGASKEFIKYMKDNHKYEPQYLNFDV